MAFEVEDEAAELLSCPEFISSFLLVKPEIIIADKNVADKFQECSSFIEFSF